MKAFFKKVLFGKRLFGIMILWGSFFCAPLYGAIAPPELPSFKVPKTKATPSKKTSKVLTQKVPTRPLKIIPVLTKRDKMTKSYRIKLQWKEATKAALFYYRDVGYLVFNAVGAFPPGSFPGSHFKRLSIIPHGQATIVKFSLKADNDLLLTRLEDDWVLLAGIMRNEKTPHIYPIVITPKEEQKSLSILNDESESLITFTDPKTGDVFAVQPDINRGIDQLYETAFFDLLETYQGLVYLLKDPENLKVQVDKEAHATLISLESGEPISSVDPTEKDRDPASLHSLVDLDKYDIPSGNIFHVGRVMRKAVALEKKPELHIQREIELAKFYLATGQYYEAIGVLSLLKERHETLFFSQDDLILMFDIAQALSHNVDDDSFLSNEGEGERDFLLALQEQRLGRYDTALTKYVRAYKFVQNLPPIIRNDVALKAYEARVESDYKKPLFAGLIDTNLLNRCDLDSVKYYEAQATRIVNPKAPLRKTYTKLTFSPNQRIALMARLALVDRENTAEKSVLKDLESMLFTWRGDIIEQRFLATLAELYRKAGQYDNALRALRSITSYLWQFEKSHIYIKLAEDLFYNSFMEMKDEPFLKQIAYYYEFEDLIPKGKRYGEVIDRITSLYVKVGLTDQAIAALKQRAKYLNFEKKRSTLGKSEHRYLMNLTIKRIAELYLTTGQAPLALKMLGRLKPFEEEGGVDNPEYLAFQKDTNFIKAVTFLNLSKKEKALGALKGLTSRRANRLKADIYMAQERWQDVLPLLEEMLQTSQGEKIKGNFDVDAVLDLAVVASHLKKKERIIDLKKEYGNRITDPEKRQVFDIIVSSPTAIEISKGKIAKQLTVADNYTKLMDGIKKDILETNWSIPLSRNAEKTVNSPSKDQGNEPAKAVASNAKEAADSKENLKKG